MGTFILKVLTSRFAGPVATCLALALSVLVAIQGLRLASAERGLRNATVMVGDLSRELGRCRTGRESLEAFISMQGAEIERFARVESERLAQADRALRAAAKGRLEAERRAVTLLQAQPEGTDACSRFMAADRAVLDSLR